MAGVAAGRHLEIGNRPGCENPKHQEDPNEMWDPPKLAQLPGFPQKCNHDRIKEEQREWTFGEECEPEKNPRYSPRKPASPGVVPPAQPEDEGERSERSINCFNLD